MNGGEAAALDIRPVWRYVVDKAASDWTDAALQNMFLFCCGAGVYTEFGGDPFFLGENGRRQYNHICKKCVHGCKQSFRACLVACPYYNSKRSKICEDKGGKTAE